MNACLLIVFTAVGKLVAIACYMPAVGTDPIESALERLGFRKTRGSFLPDCR